MAPAKKAAKKTTKKTAAKKTGAKKTAAKKTAAKKTAAKKTGGKKTATRTAKMSSKRTGRSTASNAGGAGGNVVVASKLRETVRAQDIRMSSDFVEALNEEVHDLVTKAVARAKGNGRGTVRPTDL